MSDRSLVYEPFGNCVHDCVSELELHLDILAGLDAPLGRIAAPGYLSQRPTSQ